MEDSTKHTLNALALLLGIIVIGSCGYYFIEEDWSLLDAVFMTVITITTVGFGETHALSPPGRVFTIFLILLGFGAVAMAASQIARWIIESEIRGHFLQKKRKKEISKMKNHYIICGFGQIGCAVCEELAEKKKPFVVIETDDERVKLANERGYCVIQGNATADDVLLAAGINEAAGLAAVLSSDADDLFISLAARELNPRLRIISRGEDPGADKKILRAGADIVVSPIKLGGLQIAQILTREKGQIDSSKIVLHGLNVCGLTLRPFTHYSSTPITVGDALQQSGAVAASALRRADGSLTAHPQDSLTFSSNETLILLIEEEHPTLHEEQSINPLPIRKKILLADDHQALLSLFCRKIAHEGYDVITAVNGQEAITKAMEFKPDLIVLDAMMPIKTGYEVCSLLRKDPVFKDLPIIIFSADDPKKLVISSSEAGATCCITKTSNTAELLSKINTLLRSV